MTAPWDVGPCAWPDGEQLELDLAEADRAHADLHGPQTRRPSGFESDPWHGYARPATATPRRFNPYQPINDVLEGSL
ncbi:hypothetical protein QMZ92_16525 [Streptomyces sp. HNM0645]|uniref:hypothetical protein n=1 Tax=Streptomyces sp. HNM0645 TaxID=2782343 RepID=UPI0024B6FE65|nr:hypothetical protein [Streptomyces sp. HNM0645]MDI9885941.1 hypothetical protein [Streptomyces sp. HNM0645]